LAKVILSVENRLPRKLAAAFPEIRRMAGGALLEGGEILASRAKRYIRIAGAYSTGQTRNSIEATLTESDTGAEVVVGAHTDYAYFAHEGRKPGRMPPESVIRAWVIRRARQGRFDLPASGRSKQARDERKEAIRRAVYLIRRKIAKKGTEGYPFFDLTFRIDGRVVGNRVERKIGAGVQRILEQDAGS